MAALSLVVLTTCGRPPQEGDKPEKIEAQSQPLAAAATASASIYCSGKTCYSSPTPLPDSATASVYWNPCSGGGFTWSASASFESGYDRFCVGGTAYSGSSGYCSAGSTITGSGTFSGSASGQVLLSLATDGSVSSNGLSSITATCTVTCQCSSGSCCDGCNYYSSSHVCRSSAGACDPAEYCSGSSSSCPSDSIYSSSHVCRSAVSDCDVAEYCTGNSVYCPSDSFVPEGTLCRGAADICDTPEYCTGTSAYCPYDAYLPSGTVCRDAVGACDTIERCSGDNIRCPIDLMEPPTTVCREAAGVCDAPENCDGNSPYCPTNQLRPSSYECRAAAGVCDVAENCTGNSVNCPTDTFRASYIVCRDVVGGCDVAEKCTGNSADCPTDAIQPAGAVCRASVDACDPQETCNGTSTTCPNDVGVTATVLPATGTQLVSSTTVGAPNVASGSCGGASATEREYTFTLQNRGTIDAVVTGLDAVLYLRSACTNAASEIACHHGSGSSRLSLTLDPGTYFLTVDGNGSASGSYSLSVTFVELGDSCANAVVVTGSGSVTGTTAPSTNDAGGVCGGSAAPDRVYSVTLTDRATIDAQVSGFDTVLYVRSSCGDSSTELACNNDSSPPGNHGSRINRTYNAGTYYFFVDGYSAISTGSYTLTFAMNHSPVLTPVGNRSGAEGSPLVFTVLGSDEDGDALTFSASNLPTGATFDADTHVFSWTPDYTQAGSYDVTFGLTDGRFPKSETITITIANTDRAPVLDPIGSRSGTENVPLTFTLSASDVDGDALTFSAQNLPAGATFDAGTRTFSWTPGYAQSGTFNVTFAVSDGTLSDTEVVAITVSNVNRAPVVGPVGAKSGTEGTLLSFVVPASDPDADPITLTATNLPSGATFDAGTKTFSWTPTFAQAGDYSVTFTVSDGSLSAFEVVPITIANFDHAPLIAALGPFSGTEGSVLTFTATATDQDGDPLAFFSDDLPVGATIDTWTGAFSWTPDYTTAGTHQVTISVNDGELTSSTVVTLDIANANAPPVFDPVGRQPGAEGSLLTFTVVASDVDDDPLTLSVNDLPQGAVFDAGSGVFAWTPDFTQVGTYSVTFTASDGRASGTLTVALDIANTNRAPVVSSIGPQSGLEGNLLTFALTASDPDGDALTWTTSTLPAGSTFDLQTHSFNWTPDYTEAGSYSVTISVSDGRDTTIRTIPITIQNNDRAPVLTPIGDKAGSEDHALSFPIVASDPDGESLTFSATGLPSGASLNSTTGAFAWTPGFSQNGRYTVTFSVSDGTLSTTETITITVSNTNRGPTLSPVAPVQGAEGSRLSFTLVGSDPDGQSLTYTASNLPAGAALNAASGEVIWTPGYDQAGQYNVTFTGSDGDLSDSVTVSITIANTDRAPVFDPLAAQTVAEGAPLAFTVSGSDPDGDTLTYSATDLPTGARFNTATHRFTWTPGFDQAGTRTATFLLSDGTVSTSLVVSIEVTNTNQPPHLELSAQTGAEGSLVSFVVATSDPDGDTVSISASDLPDGATLDLGTRRFSWTPDYNQAGAYTLTFQLNDGTVSVSQTVTLTIANTNRAPVLDPIPPQAGREQNELLFFLGGSDPDVDTITFSSADMPRGMVLDSATGIVSWTPDFDQAGTYQVTFSVSDGALSATAVASIVITGTNQPPTLNPIGTRSGAEGSLLSFSISGSDPEGDALTFSATGLQTGATFNAATRTFSWTPDFTQAGTYTVTFRVSDGSLSSDATGTIVIANTNRSPALSGTAPRSGAEASLLSFSISGTDPDGDLLTFAATTLPTGATFDPATQLFTWTPDYTQAGTWTAAFSVSDGLLSASANVTILIANTDRAPTITNVDPLSGNEGSPLTVTVTATDPDGDTLEFHATGLPTGANLDASTGVLTWTPDFSSSARYEVTFIASDGTLSASASRTLVIFPTNRPPVLTPFAEAQLETGMPFSVNAIASDPDGDELMLTATPLPTGATFDAATRTFSWTPQYGQAGSYTVTVTAADYALSASQTLLLTVVEGNQPPTFDPLSDLSASAGSLVSFVVKATDPEGTAVVLAMDSGPTGATFDPATGTFRWTPTASDTGKVTVQFSATDAGGAHGNAMVSITVTAGSIPTTGCRCSGGFDSVSVLGLLTLLAWLSRSRRSRVPVG